MELVIQSEIAPLELYKELSDLLFSSLNAEANPSSDEISGIRLRLRWNISLGIVASETVSALKQILASGRKLILVTGRELGERREIELLSSDR